MKNIKDLEKKTGACYILCSGASVGYFNKSFWDNKFKIGINHMAKHIPCDIIVAKEKPIRFGDEIIIVSQRQYGGMNRENNTVGDYYFEHTQNKHSIIDYPKDDKIIVSWSTITSAMHIACYLGFKDVFLCGHDCGSIDGCSNLDGYYDENNNNVMGAAYNGWVKKIEPQSIAVRDWLVNKYNVNICSLNPFVSMNMEGHSFV